MLVLSIAQTKHSILKITQPDSPLICLREPFVEPSGIVSWLTISVPEIYQANISKVSLSTKTE